MRITSAAVAGTLESSDVQVTIEPAENEGVSLELSSSVLNQFGRQIKAVILDTLHALNVESARVTVTDKGALDSTIRARVECAVYRSLGQKDNIPWKGWGRA